MSETPDAKAPIGENRTLENHSPHVKVAGATSHCRHEACRGWVQNEGASAGARIRLGLVLCIVLVLYVGLSFRLAQIQVGQGPVWAERFKQQSTFKETDQGQRGAITDRTGLPLAFSQPCDTIIADLKILKNDPKRGDMRLAAAQALSPLLGISVEALFKKMNTEDLRSVYLKRCVESEVADKIRALKIRGIGFEDAFRRIYPQGSLACHVLGFGGIEGGSKEGIELELDSILKGTPGYVRYYRDALGRLIVQNDNTNGRLEGRPAQDGLAVTLTIDAGIQLVVEQELAKIIDEFHPISATCVVMDVNTGALYAMASVPSFDPNLPANSPPEARRNRAITDVYEPGSTFKTFIAAMALEKKIWRTNDVLSGENGAWNLGYRTLHDSHAYGLLSFVDVIVKSSNIGIAKVALRGGVDVLYETVKMFGFGEDTNVQLGGEVRGLVRPRKVWSKDSVYSVAMGHEIGVTPMQLVAAYGAVVNGGMLYRPKIIQRLVNEKGEELYSLHPQTVRRVISESTSKQMREILSKVVKPGGTGTKAFCPEWAILGKTGTTKKIDPATHQYSSTRYIGSFCGAAPADNPRVVCLVTVDEPDKQKAYYGGTVACPAVREVLKKCMTVLKVPARSAEEQQKAIAESKAPAEDHKKPVVAVGH
jgi:cell division protein FtsI (penicillin-binding protein 3)